MKQLIAEHTEIKKTSLKQMFADTCNNPESTIAYLAAGRRKDTLAVLQSFNDGTYGFTYLKDLIKGYSRPSGATFQEATMTKSLKAVLKTTRPMYVFDSYHEFITYAASISEPG